MSADPPPLPELHIPYASKVPQPGAPDPRPKAVKTIAIVAIVLGGFELLSGVRALLPHLGVTTATAVNEAYWQDAVVHRWMIFSMIRELSLAIVLLVGGICALRLRPLGRILFMVYAGYGVVCGIPVQLIYWTYIQPIQDKLRIKIAPLRIAISPAVHHSVMVMSAGLILLGVAIDCYVLYLMTRPHVKVAFDRAG